MARAYGWNAKLLIAEESTYGTLSSGPFTQVPFASSAIDSEQGLISSNVLGLGRAPTTPFQDVINVEGDLAVPVDIRNIGIWLKAVFGVPETTTENGVYTHTFESGKTTLPSYSLELGLAEVPEYIRFLGARANSIAFNFARSGEAQVTVSLMAQSETASETSVSDAPEVKNYTRFSQFQGFIKSGGETLANVTSASVTYSNNLEKIETIRSDGKVEAIDLGRGLVVRFDCGSLWRQCVDGQGSRRCSGGLRAWLSVIRYAKVCYHLPRSLSAKTETFHFRSGRH